jgi:hypothetical protein
MERDEVFHILISAWLALLLAAVAVEWRKVVRSRGWSRFWWWSVAAALALVAAGHAARLHEPLVRAWVVPFFEWLFYRKIRLVKIWVALTVASLAGIALLLAWDWLFYRRLPWSRWHKARRGLGRRVRGEGPGH